MEFEGTKKSHWPARSDVEALCIFGVEIVCGPEELNEFMIVVEKVIFGKVEIIAYTKINKNLMIFVIEVQSSLPWHQVSRLCERGTLPSRGSQANRRQPRRVGQLYHSWYLGSEYR